MRNLLLLIILSLIFSCNTKTIEKTSADTSKEELLNAEVSFQNCDKLIDFLKLVIVNNHSDRSLKAGEFQLRLVETNYTNVRSLFPADCFIGMSKDVLQEIFGAWDYAGTSKNHPAWYVLQDKKEPSTIEVFLRAGQVEKFKITSSNIEKNIE